MTKVLAYCAFLHREGLKLTPCGVNNATMRVLSHGNLRLLWSYVEWPFRDSAIQRNAVEFHGAVSHMFAQGAVLPFRLLSVFDDEQAIIEFVEARKADFVADLERLRNLVQMECVIYFAPQAATGLSGKDYLERKAEVLRGAEGYAERIRNALSGISRAVRTRESKNGLRIFVLVERGQEHSFRSKVRDLPLPERLARRISGPWPPSEFLSDALKMPQISRQGQNDFVPHQGK